MIEHDQLGAASSPETTASYLRELAHHQSEIIRAAVAANQNTDEDTLLYLVGDSSEYVREKLINTKSGFCFNSYEFKACKNSKLSIVNIDDAEFIVSLRQNPSLNKYISYVDTNVDKQKKWLLDYKKREERRVEFYFIIKDMSDKRLGTVRLYDFQTGSFCWGSWVIAPNSPRKTAIESALNVYEFAFYVLGFLKSHFDVRNENVKVVNFHKRMGAEVVRSNELDTYFTFRREQYEKTRERYEQFLAY
jgi:RimJ/RimL family protein N-acetyltransferase